MDWTFGGAPILTKKCQEEAVPQSEEYLSYSLAHSRELIDPYESDVLWNDYGLPEHADVAPLLRHYRERVPHGVINDRFGGSPSHRHERDPEGPDWAFVTRSTRSRGHRSGSGRRADGRRRSGCSRWAGGSD